MTRWSCSKATGCWSTTPPPTSRVRAGARGHAVRAGSMDSLRRAAPLRADDHSSWSRMITEESPLHAATCARRVRRALRRDDPGDVPPVDEDSLEGEIPDASWRSGDVLLIRDRRTHGGAQARAGPAGARTARSTCRAPARLRSPFLIMAQWCCSRPFRVLPIAMSSLLGVLALILTAA